MINLRYKFHSNYDSISHLLDGKDPRIHKVSEEEYDDIYETAPRKIMKRKISVLILAVVSTISAQAQTSFTGTSSTGLWFSNRWNNTSDASPYTSAFTSLNSANFAAGTYTFTGWGSGNVGNITLANGATVTFGLAGSGSLATGGAVRTLNIGVGSVFNTGSNQSFSTAAGTGFIKSGAGTLALSGGTYAGGFTLNNGIVILQGVNAMGAGGALNLNGGTVAGSGTRNLTGKYTGGITITGNVQFGEIPPVNALASFTANLTFSDAMNLGGTVFTARTLTLGNNGTVTFGGVISSTGSGGITFAANANTDGRFEITNAANTFPGNVNITGGEVRFTADGSIGNAGNDIILDGGRFGKASDATTVTLSAGRDIFVGDGAGTSISSESTGTLIYNNAIANKSGEIGSWAKQGGGTLSLGGVSTYSGDTVINNGILLLTTGNDRLPTGTVVSLGQAASTNLGTLNLNGLNQQIAGLASTTGINASANKNTVTSVAAATLDINVAEGATKSYGDGTTQNSGVITGLLALTKSGSGTQTFGDANTYTGTTTVNAGILALSGTGTIGAGNVALGGGTLSIAGISTSAYTLTSTQTLSGAGQINATGKTLAVNGTLAPGSSAGTIDVTGAVTLGLNSVSNFEILGTSSGQFDLLDVTGTLTFGGSLNLTTSYAFAANDMVKLFDAETFAGTFGTINGTSLGDGLSWDTSKLYTQGSITVVPEPSTALIGGLGILALLRRRR
jgi:fibronectin-binding autotransporter adhesin